MKKPKFYFAIVVCLFVMFSGVAAFAANYSGKKILYVDSYHEGYAWSDGIAKGIETTLQGSGIQLEIVRMDTKRNTEDSFKAEAALKAKKAIESFQPDVVIAADDNASKFLIAPYYKDAKTPIVFCGVNWDAKVYGYPYKNTTGMIEVTPIPQLIDQLKPYAKGNRLGMIAPDFLTAKKEEENYRKVFGYDPVVRYAKNFEDWKKGFVEIQTKVDILIIDSDGGLYNDHLEEMKNFVETNTKIPTGSAYDFMAHAALITYAKLAEEQGAWSARAALKILDGTPPLDIPIESNQLGSLIINTRIAERLGVNIPYDLIESADRVIE